MKDTEFTVSQIIESKANEVDAWVNKKALEYRIISAIPAFSSMDVREITPLINRFTNLYMKNGEVMETFTYIGKNGFCWINSEATEDLMDYNDYRLAYSSDTEFVIGLPTMNQNHREVILFYYPVLGYGNEKEALICSAVPTVGLKGIVNTTQIYAGKTWVMNRNHEIISTNKEYFHKNYLDVETLKSVNTKSITSSGMIPIVDANGEACTLFFTPVPHYNDWITCNLVRNSELSKQTDELMAGSLFLFFLLLIVTALLGLFLTYLVMKPIKRLQSCMNQVEEGNLDAYYDSKVSKDEIYELGLTYNKMLERISDLIGRIYKEQEEKRKAEAAVMQAQIKPHFLYNTLDNLKWMAKEQGAEEVASTITSLSTFFRIFLSNGKEMIKIAEEFKHTKAYLDIQSIRYKEKLSYEIELEEEIKSYSTLKIIIQPMVENAIYHGIKPKEGRGHILITGKRTGDFIEFTIRDDGIGMSSECLEELNKRLQSLDSSKHFGMVNTLTRLKATYGEEASLIVSSEPFVGTTVTVKFKVTEDIECIEQ
jgi:two-component system sensor histidine kinase YesM